MFIKSLFFILFAQGVFAQVVTTLPEFAWIVKELNPKLDVKSFLNGNEDPHFVDASPSFVFKAARAKLLIKNGMQLEMGWLPPVTEQSGNADVQIGGKGHCDASSKVNKIGIIENYDRSMGDVHPVGNPHYSLSLVEMKSVIETISRCLKKVGLGFIEENQTNLLKRFDEVLAKTKEQLAPLKQKKFMVYHIEFNYFMRDFGLKSVGSLEEVPGVLPSAIYLAKTAKKAMDENVALVFASNVSPDRYLEKFKDISSIKYVKAQVHPLNQDDFLKHYQLFVNEVVKNVGL